MRAPSVVNVKTMRVSPSSHVVGKSYMGKIEEQDGANVIEWLSSKQRDKDSIIEEGKKQNDKNTWLKGLNKFESYLARKYKSEIKSEPAPKQSGKFENVEL